MPDNFRIQTLFERYLHRSCTEAELMELKEYFEGNDTDDQLEPSLRAVWNTNRTPLRPVDWEMMYQNVISAGTDIPASKKIVAFNRTSWLVAAAAVVIALLLGYSWWQISAPRDKPVVAHTNSKEVSPGKDGAILTLEDGSKLVLDEIGDSAILTGQGERLQVSNGRLIYKDAGVTTGKPVYNTITTPKGRQFSIQLPDGSVVWLNAASSLRFPVHFSPGQRVVEVTGEAYFEVAGSSVRPFRVAVNGETEIDVLGTAFNISAYTNENRSKTTLVNGNIRVSRLTKSGAPAAQLLLKPGQQAVIYKSRVDNTIQLEEKISVDKEIAWRKGGFDFNGLTLREVMRQLERWYDIDVVYEGDVPDIRFVGKMSRNVSLQGVLKGLTAAEVHYRMENPGKLVISP